MNTQQKISELKKIIQENLTPLITHDYIFLDLPYFANVGDILIWQGTLDFLKTLPYRCLYSSSIENYRKPEIDKNVVILFMGGGNFGDLWYRHQIFREKILACFPENKIIQLPQSIYFKDENVLEKSAEIFSRHKNLIMCFRDEYSLNVANEYFPDSNNILLPDMAFCMDLSIWKQYIKPAESRILFLDRKDTEKNFNHSYSIVPPEAEIRDWPTMERISTGCKLFYLFQKGLNKMDTIFGSNLNNYFADLLYKNVFRKSFIKSGIRFLSAYSYIYTTRLHVAILSVLLGKEFSFFDNSYGKNKGFYEAWLQDVETIKLVNNND